MEKTWGELFIEATQSILDAFSHVDEFDMHEFISSVFTSSKYMEDVNAQIAKVHAEKFIQEANKVISTLMTYRPKDNENPDTPESWWHDRAQYERACTRLTWLQNWVDVIQRLQMSIEALTGVEFTATRKGLLTFKKECIEALNGLNNVINAYNRFVVPNHSDYKLDTIQF